MMDEQPDNFVVDLVEMLIQRLLDNKRSGAVGVCADIFAQLTPNHDALALKLFSTGHGHEVANHLDKFTNLTWSHQDLIKTFLALQQVDAIASNLDRFTGLTWSHDVIAQKLVEVGGRWAVVQNIDKFHDLSEAMRESIVK